MLPRVYIETTIPSFYFESRQEPDMIARRDWTRAWWKRSRSRYELVTSLAVIEELEAGAYPGRRQALKLVAELTMVPVVPAIAEIVSAYIARRVMPRNPAGDALHLALASYHKCDFLLTWNCNHLANANKFGHIRRVNSDLGLIVPALVTPLELSGGIDESEG